MISLKVLFNLCPCQVCLDVCTFDMHQEGTDMLFSMVSASITIIVPMIQLLTV